jgi:predicted Fe-S protein YdhL (DUF1289 family)
MITPCINVCKIVDNKCAGCGRTLDEIARWSMMTDTERNNVMNKLKG